MSRERVVSWLFQFWELLFPAELREAAVELTWRYLQVKCTGHWTLDTGHWTPDTGHWGERIGTVVQSATLGQ